MQLSIFLPTGLSEVCKDGSYSPCKSSPMSQNTADTCTLLPQQRRHLCTFNTIVCKLMRGVNGYALSVVNFAVRRLKVMEKAQRLTFYLLSLTVKLKAASHQLHKSLTAANTLSVCSTSPVASCNAACSVLWCTMAS